MLIYGRVPTAKAMDDVIVVSSNSSRAVTFNFRLNLLGRV